MKKHTPVNALYLVCDLAGNILRKLRDDISLVPHSGSPASFFELFPESDRQHALGFWEQLLLELTVLDCELQMKTNGLSTVFKFSGFVHDGTILITGTSYSETNEAMYDEIMQMNNEQQNQLRHSIKSFGTLKKIVENNEVDMLNELTQLNNELVNTQRMLSKKNAEINTLNIQLHSINTDLEQFTYVASHDLQEPLRMITGFMELLQLKYGEQLDKKANTYISFALDGGKRMHKLIVDLLELSRVGRKDSAKEPNNLNDILAEVQKNLSLLIRESNTQLTVKKALPVLPVFQHDINRLFQNLISNAIKFRKKEVSLLVEIDVKEKDDSWLFSFADNGIGIEAGQFEKIFEVFTRLNTREAYEGTGIGLAVCKKVVEYHGGKIWVNSQEGKGSTFYFTLMK